MFSSKNKHRKMQDPLSFTFCWGETFDTPPYSGLHVRGVVTAGYTSRGLDDGLFVRAGREGERRQLADDLHRVDAQTDDRVEQVNDVAGGALLTAP